MVKKQVHQNQFHQKTVSSKTVSSKSNFIHVDTIIKNHFHQKPLSSKPFWLKPFLARGNRCSHAVCPIALVVCVHSFGLVFSCLFTSTDHNAQGMDEGTSVGWLGANRHGPAPKVGAMATCESNVEVSEAQSQSTRYSIRRSHSPSETAQSSAGESRDGSERRGAQVGGPQSPHLEARKVLTQNLCSML